VALKLGKTSLSLNKRLKESAQIAVTSGMGGDWLINKWLYNARG